MQLARALSISKVLSLILIFSCSLMGFTGFWVADPTASAAATELGNAQWNITTGTIDGVTIGVTDYVPASVTDDVYLEVASSQNGGDRLKFWIDNPAQPFSQIISFELLKELDANRLKVSTNDTITAKVTANGTDYASTTLYYRVSNTPGIDVAVTQPIRTNSSVFIYGAQDVLIDGPINIQEADFDASNTKRLFIRVPSSDTYKVVVNSGTDTREVITNVATLTTYDASSKTINNVSVQNGNATFNFGTVDNGSGGSTGDNGQNPNQVTVPSSVTVYDSQSQRWVTPSEVIPSVFFNSDSSGNVAPSQLLQIQLRGLYTDIAMPAQYLNSTFKISVDLSQQSFDPVVLIGRGFDSIFDTIDGMANGWIYDANTHLLTVYAKPSSFAVDNNGDNVAEHAHEGSVLLAADQFGYLEDGPSKEQIKTINRGLTVTTNAQSFGRPEYIQEGGHARLKMFVEGPHFMADGVTVNTGFFRAFLPPAMLESWNVQTSAKLLASIGDGNENTNASALAFSASGDNTQGITVEMHNFTYSPHTISISSNTSMVNVTDVALNKEALTVQVGTSETLTATVSPNDATNKQVTWRSSAPSVAAVSETGVVTGVSSGTATITAVTVDGGKSASAVVTVPSPISPTIHVTGVALNKDALTIQVGASETLTATVAPNNATNKQVTWRSSEPNVANVSASGVVTGISAGTATISVVTEDGEKSASAILTVTALNANTGDGSTGNTGNNGNSGVGNGSSDATTTPKSDENTDKNSGDVKNGVNGITLGAGAARSSEEVAANGKSITKVVLDGEKLSNAFGLLKDKEKQAQTIIVELDGKNEASKVTLPANTLVGAVKSTPDAVISIRAGEVTYDLPIKAIDIERLSKDLGTDLQDARIDVKMEKVSGSTAEQVNAKANEHGIELLADLIEFSVTVVAGDKTIELNNFGSTYVSRAIVLDRVLDTGKATGVMINPETGEFTFVPTTILTVDGKTHVIMKRPGNSLYSVVQSFKTFDDLSSHWAKSDIELLASKFIVKGKSETSFNPNDGISRAEFTALLVRSLGLTEDKTGANFPDVNSSDWYAGVIGTAVKAGLIDGLSDGTFTPNNYINREEMAVMLSRALHFAGKNIDSTTGQAQILEKFNDGKAVADWAQQSVAHMIEAGIITGLPNNTLVPEDHASRAQAAVMLKRLLQYVQFLN